MSSTTSLRRLGSGAAAYGVATILSRVTAFVMLPVYTRVLHPADYGILQMLDLSADVLSILLSAGATAGVMRFYYTCETEAERRRLLSSAFAMLFGLEMVGAVLLAIAAPFIVEPLLGPDGTTTMVLLAAANFLLGSLTAMPMLQFVIEERSVTFAAISITKLLLQVSLNLLFLLYFKLGALGILCATFVTALLIGGYCTTRFIRENGIAIAWPDITRLKRFAIPYQIAAAGSFILTFGDRFFLKKFLPIDSVGIYGLASQFGFLLIAVTSGPIIGAWTPIRHQEATLSRQERDLRYNRGLLMLSSVTVAGAVGISLFAGPALRIMSSEGYWGAAKVIPIIALAFLIRSWSDSFTFSFDITEQPRHIATGTWSSVALIFVLFVVLIPRFGEIGAAMAMACAFAFRLALYWYLASKVWPAHVAWQRHAMLLVFGMAAYAASVLVNAPTVPLQLLTATACFAAFAGLAILVLPPDIRKALAEELRRRVRAVMAVISPTWGVQAPE